MGIGIDKFKKILNPILNITIIYVLYSNCYHPDNGTISLKKNKKQKNNIQTRNRYFVCLFPSEKTEGVHLQKRVCEAQILHLPDRCLGAQLLTIFYANIQ